MPVRLPVCLGSFASLNANYSLPPRAHTHSPASSLGEGKKHTTGTIRAPGALFPPQHI